MNGNYYCDAETQELLTTLETFSEDYLKEAEEPSQTAVENKDNSFGNYVEELKNKYSSMYKTSSYLLKKSTSE